MNQLHRKSGLITPITNPPGMINNPPTSRVSLSFSTRKSKEDEIMNQKETISSSQELLQSRPDQSGFKELVTEAMKLNQTGYSFNPDYFFKLLFTCKSGMDTVRDKSDLFYSRITEILEQYMTSEELNESNIEQILLDYPDQAFFDGFLQGFQMGFTMFQYMDEHYNRTGKE